MGVHTQLKINLSLSLGTVRWLKLEQALVAKLSNLNSNLRTQSGKQELTPASFSLTSTLCYGVSITDIHIDKYKKICFNWYLWVFSWQSEFLMADSDGQLHNLELQDSRLRRWVFLDWLNWGGKTHPKCGEHHCLGWRPEPNKKEKRGKRQCSLLSASWLCRQCDRLQRPHAPATCLLHPAGCHPWTVSQDTPFHRKGKKEYH